MVHRTAFFDARWIAQARPLIGVPTARLTRRIARITRIVEDFRRGIRRVLIGGDVGAGLRIHGYISAPTACNEKQQTASTVQASPRLLGSRNAPASRAEAAA